MTGHDTSRARMQSADRGMRIEIPEFALVLLVAFATRIRHKIIRKMINWLKKGAVIKMVRKVIAGPWWASACALGATALTAYGESG